MDDESEFLAAMYADADKAQRENPEAQVSDKLIDSEMDNGGLNMESLSDEEMTEEQK